MGHPHIAASFRLDGGGYLLVLTSDPSAGAGVPAPISSVGLRDNSGAGELWLKTGAADTAWTLQAGGVAAHDVGGAAHNADTFANFSTKISDATLAALGIQQAFSKQQRATPYALTAGGANISVPVVESNVYTVTITQATQQLDNVTGTIIVGMQWMVIVKQDSTGGRALTFGTEYDWGDEDAPDFTVLTGNQYAIVNCTVISVSPNIVFAVYVGGAG